jgi:hypothetical protein
LHVLDVYCILYFLHLLGGFLHICVMYMYYICGLWPPDNVSCLFLTWYQSICFISLPHAQLVLDSDPIFRLRPVDLLGGRSVSPSVGFASPSPSRSRADRLILVQILHQVAGGALMLLSLSKGAEINNSRCCPWPPIRPRPRP